MEDESYLYKRECKIVGGSNDGEYITIDTRIPFVKLPEKQTEFFAIDCSNTDKIAVEMTINVETYERKEFRSTHNSYHEYHYTEEN